MRGLIIGLGLIAITLIGVTGCTTEGRSSVMPSIFKARVNGQIEFSPAEEISITAHGPVLISGLSAKGNTSYTSDGETYSIPTDTGVHLTSTLTDQEFEKLRGIFIYGNQETQVFATTLRAVPSDSIIGASTRFFDNVQTIGDAVAGAPGNVLGPALASIYKLEYWSTVQKRLGLTPGDGTGDVTFTGSISHEFTVGAEVAPQYRSVTMRTSNSGPGALVVTFGSPPLQTTATYPKLEWFIEYTPNPIEGGNDTFTITLNGQTATTAVPELNIDSTSPVNALASEILRSSQQVAVIIDRLGTEVGFNSPQIQGLHKLAESQLLQIYCASRSWFRYHQPFNPGVNNPPVVSNPKIQKHQEGKNVSLQIAASDPDNDQLIFVATGLPVGLSIDMATGKITGVLPEGSRGYYTVDVVVSDTRGGASSIQFLWNVYPYQFVVTTTVDEDDGSFDPSVGAGLALREAIRFGNESPGENLVTFRVEVEPAIFKVTIPLPHITKPLYIDGTTQSGFKDFPVITLRGSDAGSNANGLVYGPGSAGSKVVAVRIDRFGGAGILVIDTRDVSIGGNTPDSGNMIVENGRSGIEVVDSDEIEVKYNWIGTDSKNGKDLGNKGPGVKVQGGSQISILDDHIFYNYKGITVVENTSTVISGTAVSNNDGNLAIDIGDDGVTPNDDGDNDDVVNTPVITAAVFTPPGATAPRTFVTGTYKGRPNTPYMLHAYWDFNPVALAAPLSAGQGQHPFPESYAQVINTDDFGVAQFSMQFPPVPPTSFASVTATLLDQYGEKKQTSEFSATKRLPPFGVIPFTRTASVLINFETPDGEETISASGGIGGRLYANSMGIAYDTDGNGKEEMWFELTSVSLSGVSPTLGTINISLRPTGAAPYQRTMGWYEEHVNSTPFTFDIPPFVASGTASAKLEFFFEATTSVGVVHNIDPYAAVCRPDHPVSPCSIPQIPPPVVDLAGDENANDKVYDENGRGIVAIINGKVYRCSVGRFEFAGATWVQRTLTLLVLWGPIAFIVALHRRARKRRVEPMVER